MISNLIVTTTAATIHILSTASCFARERNAAILSRDRKKANAEQPVGMLQPRLPSPIFDGIARGYARCQKIVARTFAGLGEISADPKPPAATPSRSAFHTRAAEPMPVAKQSEPASSK